MKKVQDLFRMEDITKCEIANKNDEQGNVKIPDENEYNVMVLRYIGKYAKKIKFLW